MRTTYMEQHFVFLIDDDKDDRELFCDVLKVLTPHLRCDFAANAKDALDRLQHADFPVPELIFLDLNMPGMGGLELLVALRNLHKLRQVPIIIYSTSDHEKDKCTAKGAAGFVVKSYSFEGLLGQVEEIFLHYGLANERYNGFMYG